MDVLVLLRFVSFPGLKNEAYTCVLSLFRRAFAPFHSFTVLDSIRGFKNELCHSRSVFFSAHSFKNEFCFLCSVHVLTHRFKKDLCMCTVLNASTHGFKNEFCCRLYERVLLPVRLASLDLGLKERVILHVPCACFDSWHDKTS